MEAKFSVIVVSDRIAEGKAEDRSGKIATNEICRYGYEVVFYTVVRNRREEILRALENSREHGANTVLLIGGTGIGPRDITVDVIKSIAEKTIPGFGELFRYLTFKKEGTKAWLSRALAVTYKGMLVFATPGSPNAVELALKELILPEINHALKIISGISHWGKSHY